MQELQAERIFNEANRAECFGLRKEVLGIFFAEGLEHRRCLGMVKREELSDHDGRSRRGFRDRREIGLFAPIFGSARKPPTSGVHRGHRMREAVYLIQSRAVGPILVKRIKEKSGVWARLRSRHKLAHLKDGRAF